MEVRKNLVAVVDGGIGRMIPRTLRIVGIDMIREPIMLVELNQEPPLDLIRSREGRELRQMVSVRFFGEFEKRNVHSCLLFLFDATSLNLKISFRRRRMEEFNVGEKEN